MRWSLVLAASAASASILRRSTFGNSVNLPADAFPKFEVVSLEDAKAGKDRAIQGLPDPDNTTDTTEGKVSTHGFSVLAATTATTANAAACSANPNIRFEWRDYSASDRLAFVKAVKCLMNKPPSGNFPPAKSRYEDFVRLHQNYMTNVHNNAKFLIWHRYYLWTFEQVLRTECGFNRAMVWWDETLDAGKFAQSDMFTNPLYFGSLPASSGPQCLKDGEFAGLVANIGPGNSNSAHCVSRQVTESNTAQCSADFINYCNQRTSYADYESCLEYGPHGYGHNGVGGTMADVWASPSDPIFWMHHSFVDHSWRMWQNLDASRIASINGVDAAGNALTLDTMVYMGGIRPDVRVRDIINTLGGTQIGNEVFCYRYTY